MITCSTAFHHMLLSFATSFMMSGNLRSVFLYWFRLLAVTKLHYTTDLFLRIIFPNQRRIFPCTLHLVLNSLFISVSAFMLCNFRSQALAFHFLSFPFLSNRHQSSEFRAIVLQLCISNVNIQQSDLHGC